MIFLLILYTLFQPEFLNICFWYVPPSLRGLDHKEKMSRLEKVIF